MPISKLNRTVIEAAIVGFEAQKTQIDIQIGELRAMLSGGPVEAAATPEAPAPKRKKFSAAARRKMAEAQKARWAKIKGESGPSASAPAALLKAKRKLSAATKAKLVANLKRARAAKAAMAKGAAAKKTAPAPKAKRKFSAAGRAAIVAANKKMWERRRAAAKAAKKTATAQAAT
jgi:hypothetical protein